MRFTEFSEEWKKTILRKECIINPQTKGLDNQFLYIDLESVVKGQLIKQNVILKKDAPSRAQRVLSKWDIIFQCVRPYQLNNYIVRDDISMQRVASTGYAQIRTQHNPNFFFQLLHTKSFTNQVLNRCTGTNYPAINSTDLSDVEIFIPKKEEQEKIGSLLTFLDERIAIQNKVIEKLKTLMKGINDELMYNPNWEKVQVGDFMDFYSTNSLSWEQLSYEDGQIKNLHYGLIHVVLPTIVDCKKTSLPYIQDSSIPSQYIICKNGDVAFADASEDTSEVGKAVELNNIDDIYIVCGLHTIHGRDVRNKTICGFKGFAFNSKYFHHQIRRIAQGSKVYSISTDNIKSCHLYIPEFKEQQKVVGLLHCMQDKIEAEEQILRFYEMQKRHLLQQMFI